MAEQTAETEALARDQVTAERDSGDWRDCGDGECTTCVPRRKALRTPTTKEAEAILTLVRGGWLRLELTSDPGVTP